eukprot:s207_g21.t1
MLVCNVYFIFAVTSVASIYYLGTCWYSTWRLDALKSGAWNRSAALATIVTLSISMMMLSYAALQLHPEAAEHVGHLALFFSVCLFAAPLSSLRSVLRDKSSELLPLLPSLLGLLCSGCWCYIGRRHDSKPLWVPNFIGFLLSCVQLILIGIFPAQKVATVGRTTATQPSPSRNHGGRSLPQLAILQAHDPVLEVSRGHNFAAWSLYPCLGHSADNGWWLAAPADMRDGHLFEFILTTFECIMGCKVSMLKRTCHSCFALHQPFLALVGHRWPIIAMANSSDPSDTGRVASPIREKDEEANQDLTQLRNDISELKMEMDWLKNRLYFFVRIGGYMFGAAVIVFLKYTHSFDSSLLNVSKITRVETLPPYYMIIFTSFVGSALELFLLGPPAYESKEKEWSWKELAATLFRAYLLIAFLYNVYVDAIATFAFAQDILKLDLPTVNVVCDILAFLLFKMSSGGNADDAVKRLAMLVLVFVHVKFFKAHSGNPKDLEDASHLASKMLCDANGPLFTLWWWLTLPYLSASLAMFFFGIIPLMIIYFWMTIPLALFFTALSYIVIKLFTAIRIWNAPLYHPLHADVPFQPLEMSDENRIRFVGQQTLYGFRNYPYEKDAYAHDLTVLMHTKVCYSALRVFLQVSLAGPVAFPFYMCIAIRLLNGHGYMPALLETISERHWYTFLDTWTKSAWSAIDLIGRLL